MAEGKALGDVTTLADPAVAAKLRDQYADKGRVKPRLLRSTERVSEAPAP